MLYLRLIRYIGVLFAILTLYTLSWCMLCYLGVLYITCSSFSLPKRRIRYIGVAYGILVLHTLYWCYIRYIGVTYVTVATYTLPWRCIRYFYSSTLSCRSKFEQLSLTSEVRTRYAFVSSFNKYGAFTSHKQWVGQCNS